MMQLLYNSENFSIAAVDLSQIDQTYSTRGGYEIVDKLNGKGLYLEGDMAQRFQLEVKRITDETNEADDLEAYLEYYAGLMHQVYQN